MLLREISVEGRCSHCRWVNGWRGIFKVLSLLIKRGRDKIANLVKDRIVPTPNLTWILNYTVVTDISPESFYNGASCV